MPKIPLAQWIDAIVAWAQDALAPLFDFVTHLVTAAVNGLDTGLQAVPWWLLVILVVAIAWLLSGPREGWKLALGSAIGLIFDLGLWSDFLLTLSLVLVATLVSLVIGIPVGIWSASNRTVHAVVFPILDFMQALPYPTYGK